MSLALKQVWNIMYLRNLSKLKFISFAGLYTCHFQPVLHCLPSASKMGHSDKKIALMFYESDKPFSFYVVMCLSKTIRHFFYEEKQ